MSHDTAARHNLTMFESMWFEAVFVQTNVIMRNSQTIISISSEHSGVALGRSFSQSAWTWQEKC